MSTISVYTATSNAIENEYCVIEGIKSALLFANEVIVVDSYSSDGTVEQIKKIRDPRIKIYYNDWLENIGRGMYPTQKNMSLGRCTSDWCILMDSDEVFHEQDADRIKRSVESVGKNICAIKFNTIHFYGDYDHVLNGCGAWKDLYENKIYMIRNGLGIHHGSIGGDSDAHVLNDCSPIPQPRTVHMLITMYHYGHARSTECYERKQNLIERRHCVNGPSSYVDVNVNMIDKSVLSKFAGTHPAVMGDRVSVGTSDHAKIVGLYV